MKPFIRILTIVAWAVIPTTLAAQFTGPEVARRGFWETFLAAADIVKSEAAGEGVTRPFKLYLKQGDVESKAFWKNVREKLPNGAWDDWRYEIAAYRIDKLLGLNMIPPVIEREFNGKPGSLSLFAVNKHSLLKVMDEGIPIPAEAADAINKMKYITRAFDCLVANDDRTQQNILLTEDWRTILIDHSRAFRSDPEHTARLIYGQDGFKTASGRPMLFRQLPRSFVQSVRSLDAARIRAAVGTYLTEGEIAAVMARRTLLLADIDGLIKEKGEASVLY